MEFYETVKNRRTVREFEPREVPETIVEKILEAGLMAPTNDHRREWEFVVIRGNENIKKVLGEVSKNAAVQLEKVKNNTEMGACQKNMYLESVPRQQKMLSDSGCLIVPFFKPNGEFLRPAAQNILNPFASIWCCVENILLAAAAEGLGCSLRIPAGDEPEYVAEAVKAPKGYRMACYLGVGYPAKDRVTVIQPEVSIKEKIHMEEW